MRTAINTMKEREERLMRDLYYIKSMTGEEMQARYGISLSEAAADTEDAIARIEEEIEEIEYVSYC